MTAALLRLALAQINSTVGDVDGNAALIRDHAHRARSQSADLILFPEMALTGYPPEDLLLAPAFLKKTAAALEALRESLPWDLVAVVGAPTLDRGRRRNSAVVFHGGKIRGVYHKARLPNYGVFDEVRYFSPGIDPFLFTLGGVRIGVSICEDIWEPRGPAWAAAQKGAGLLLNLSASPYHAGKIGTRRKIIAAKVRECRAALAYCNAVGGQDELVYDGGSLVLDARGQLKAQAPQFEDHLLCLDLTLPRSGARGGTAFAVPQRPEKRTPLPSVKTAPLPPVEEIYTALTVGLRDYVRKNGFKKVVLGLSGGIDSALVACLAVDALGPENVVGVTLPSRFNAAATRSDAEVLAQRLGIAFHTVPIDGIVGAFETALAGLFAGRPRDVTEENLQSRVRGTLLMALSNKWGWLVLTTGNKSEVSVGYFTLYGDSAGGFAPIRDVPKTQVYALARWRNGRGAPIPDSVLDRAPSAELRDNQTDQDSLPPYDELDRVVRLHVEENKHLDELKKAGVEDALARRVLSLIDRAEYKRRQAPPGVKITPRAFGRDRRMPITHRFHPWERP